MAMFPRGVNLIIHGYFSVAEQFICANTLPKDSPFCIRAEIASVDAANDAVQSGWIEGLRIVMNSAPIIPQFVFDRAASAGQIEIMRMLRTEHGGIHNLDDPLKLAAQGGHTQAVQLLVSWGAEDVNAASFWAARGGHTSTLRELKELKADCYISMFRAATSEGHVDCMRLVDEWGRNHDMEWSSEYYWAMNCAIENGHLNAMKLLKSLGAGDYLPALRLTANSGSSAAKKVLAELEKDHPGDARG